MQLPGPMVGRITWRLLLLTAQPMGILMLLERRRYEAPGIATDIVNAYQLVMPMDQQQG
jgi:hypothetical protein